MLDDAIRRGSEGTVFSVDVQIHRWLFTGRLTPETAQSRDAGELVELLAVGCADPALLFVIADQKPYPADPTAG